MATKSSIETADHKQLEELIPKKYFLMRGQVQAALGLTKHEFKALVKEGVFVAKYPCGSGTRARFVRSQVMAAAKRWAAQLNPKD